jgi:hypothetical protein
MTFGFILILTSIHNSVEVFASGKVRGKARRVLVPPIVQQSIVGSGRAIHGARLVGRSSIYTY